MVKYSALDRTFGALSDPTRREILERLAEGPASISELTRPAGMSMPGLLKHVRILEQAQLVTTEKQGRVRQCRLDPGHLDDAERWIQALAAALGAAARPAGELSRTPCGPGRSATVTPAQRS
jgi:DNA-binding transcriptional ArsR family regulator